MPPRSTKLRLGVDGGRVEMQHVGEQRRADRARRTRRVRPVACEARTASVVGLSGRQQRKLVHVEDAHGGGRQSGRRGRGHAATSQPSGRSAAATSRCPSPSVQIADTPRPRSDSSTCCRSMRRPYILTNRLLRPSTSYSPFGCLRAMSPVRSSSTRRPRVRSSGARGVAHHDVGSAVDQFADAVGCRRPSARCGIRHRGWACRCSSGCRRRVRLADRPFGRSPRSPRT